MADLATTTPFLQAFAKLPDLMKSIYLHDETADFNVEIFEKYELSPEQGMKMAKLLQLIVMKSLSPKDLPPRIETDLLLDTKRAKALSIDILGLRCLPMEWYIGPVAPIIRNLGGDPEKYLARIRPIYPEVFANASLKLVPDLDPEDVKLFGTQPTGVPPSAHHAEILDHFTERLGDFSGRAEILLRLTGLATELEERVKSGTLDQVKAEKMITDLDAMSNAINTRDLNPFEVQALHRRLSRMLGELE